MTGPRFRVVAATKAQELADRVNVLLDEHYRILSCNTDQDGYYAFMLRDPEPVEDEKP